MAAAEESRPARSVGIPLEEWSGAGATKELHATIKEFVRSSDQASRRMVQLTWAIVALTVMMLVAVVVQIVIALKAIP
jgi:hypothetical protein